MLWRQNWLWYLCQCQRHIQFETCNMCFSGLSSFRTHLAIIHQSVSHADGDDIVDVETCVGVDDQRHRAFAHQNLHSNALFLYSNFFKSDLIGSCNFVHWTPGQAQGLDVAKATLQQQLSTEQWPRFVSHSNGVVLNTWLWRMLRVQEIIFRDK